MGRHTKLVLTSEGIDRRETGYYATPRFVADFLGQYMLRKKPDGARVFDPCVGKEELLAPFASAGKRIDTMDIEDHGKHALATFTQRDFFQFLCAQQEQTLPYDYYVANPPYNCHESAYVRANKRELLDRFADIGVANLYSMFIAGLIDLAKPGALIGLVTLDSFLTAKMHAGLRRKILAECSVQLLALCPTDLFRDQQADVRTCLLVLQKGRNHQLSVDVLNRTRNSGEFEAALSTGSFSAVSLTSLILTGAKDHAEFVLDCPPALRELFAHRRLGDQFPCITGVSTGNDAKFLTSERTDRHTVPFYKNPGSRRFFCAPDAYLPTDFLEIAKQTPTFMVRNKHQLFEEGIVCSSMGVRFGACHRPPGTAFGVNANIVAKGPALFSTLAFLNSNLATYLVRGVLLRSNMITSGYVARIPFPPLGPAVSEKLAKLAQKSVTAGIKPSAYPPVLAAIDQMIAESLGFPPDLRNRLANFSTHLLHAT